MFWFRELLTNNCIQPRVAIEIEGQTKTFPCMGPLNVSFETFLTIVKRISLFFVMFFFQLICMCYQQQTNKYIYTNINKHGGAEQ